MFLRNPLNPSSASSGFVRAAATLVSGTASAHLITAAAMPILSRLFDPGEFGALAVFAGIVGTIAAAACLRFDVAIAVPEKDRDAFGLLGLGLLSATVVSLAAAAMVAVFPGWIAQITSQPALQRGAWLIPVGIFAAATCSALQNWSIRDGRFAQLARVRVGQSLSGSGVQIATGLGGGGALGLLVGNVVNTAVAAAYLAVRLVPRARILARELDPGALRRLWSTYRRFPVYSTWEALANSAAIHVPVILVAAVAAPDEAGYLMLAMYVLQAPMSLIGAAVGQVYLSKAPEAYRRGNLAQFTADVLNKLTAYGVGPIIAIGILSPLGFGVIFGDGWERAGRLVAWMTPWFVLQFLATPVSMSLHIAGRQRAAMLIQLFALLVRVAVVWLASQLFAESVGEAYAISGLVVYSAYLVLVANVAGCSRQHWRRVLVTARKWILPWVAASTVSAAALSYWMHSHG